MSACPTPTSPLIAAIDLHSHVLPGIDDGCRTLEESLDCLRQFAAAGYRGTICTPHFMPDHFPEIIPANIQIWVEVLRKELSAAKIDYELWSGGEVRLAAETLQWFAQYGVPTLGPSRAVLVDWWGTDWPDFTWDIFDWLQAEGYQAILAHPERMGLPAIELENVLSELEQRGVWLQGNLNSLSQGEGRRAAECSRKWLEAGRYRVLASDMHRPDALAGRFAGLRLAEQITGQEVFRDLLCSRPAEFVQSS